MEQSIYRFRSTEGLLERFELQNQEIYFAFHRN